MFATALLSTKARITPPTVVISFVYHIKECQVELTKSDTRSLFLTMKLSAAKTIGPMMYLKRHQCPIGYSLSVKYRIAEQIVNNNSSTSRTIVCSDQNKIVRASSIPMNKLPLLMIVSAISPI